MTRARAGAALEALWYGGSRLAWALAPLGWLYCGAALLRRAAYRSGFLAVQAAGVPVVVVGNVTVGGTGKTPLVLWVVEAARRAGFSPGVVSRGYGGRARDWPRSVEPGSDPALVGDEPVLVARRARCPVVVGPDRVAAARRLVEGGSCDLVVADDGLQHLRLHRDLEIAVIDGARRFGNGRCLPAGPLREPAARLRSVDLVVSRGPAARGEYPMAYRPGPLRRVRDDSPDGAPRPGASVHGVAGIGHPPQFFAQLRSLGFEVTPHPYPDHHIYAAGELEPADERPVIMTEKDAVKCRSWAGRRHWYLPVDAAPSPHLEPRLHALLETLRHGQEAA